MGALSGNTPSPGPGSVYLAEVLEAAPRLLSMLDREPHSPTSGCFDRDHWGWKFRDFPITMLQIAHYPLAQLWALKAPDNPYHQNPRLLEWIVAALRWTLRRQHRNGAFESVAPFARDHGVTLAMVYGLTETANILDRALPDALRGAVVAAVHRACRFALESDEDYAFITNHQALFALAFQNAKELTGEVRYEGQAEQIINRILERQSADGWYQEYGGPDPGYESLAISYLANYYRKRGGARQLLGSLDRGVKFFAYCVHCDGSVGGLYGSRHSCLYYPDGFESLASLIPEAASVARFIRSRLARRNVLTPRACDAENLPSLSYSYLRAYLAASDAGAGTTALPCETFDGAKAFPDSGITVFGTPSYYAVVNASKGGVCRIFSRASGKIAYEDPGWRIRAGKKKYTSQALGSRYRVEGMTGNEVVSEAVFTEALQTALTPGRFLVLRLLNLTLFRSRRIADAVRRLVIGRLITAKRPGPFRLVRRIRFLPEEVRISDRLEKRGRVAVDELDLPRAWTALHMGSAKYFCASELEQTPQPHVAELTGILNRDGAAEFVHSVRLAEVGGSPPAPGAPVMEVAAQ
jgi:hypothetical protein